MIAAEQLGADESVILDYANSGDVPAGDRSRVVGYTAAAFYKASGSKGIEEAESFNLSGEERAHLLGIARNAVKVAVEEGEICPCDDGGYPALSIDRGAFVTLTESGNLRGCIGYTSPIKPLYETVRDVAISAAMNDPRFPSVQQNELPRIQYEISVLSPFHKVADIGQIEIGKHGLLIKRGRKEGLLLPQVATDYNWNRKTFLENTCRKAGLPTNAWEQEDTDVFMFTALVFDAEDL
jgi:AmmeMemoRadiSam system protein A